MLCKTLKVFPRVIDDHFIYILESGNLVDKLLHGDNMVVGIPTSGKKELREYPDVSAVDMPYTNLANVTQYLEAVIPTLNYETSSISRSTVN